MPTETIATVEKMLESLPAEAQERVVEHLREYVLDLQDELQWDALFQRTQDKLIATARRVKKEISDGKAEPLDFERL